MEVLKGSGHFAIGFMLGYFVFFILQKTKKDNWQIRIWGPFSPFIFGVLASFPYALQLVGWLDLDSMNWKLNFCVFYNILHYNKSIIAIFNNFIISLFSIAFIYFLLINHYIRLIVRVSKHAQ